MWSFIQAAATSLPEGEEVVLGSEVTGGRNADDCNRNLSFVHRRRIADLQYHSSLRGTERDARQATSPRTAIYI